MADSLRDQLRKAINARHAAALQALDEISDYLTTPATATNGQSSAKSGKRTASRKGGKFRPGVIAATTQEFLSVQEIATKTGFSRSQIRGVLLAPTMKAQFTKRVAGDVTQYKYEGEPMK
jgi:hypothetical protein